MSAFTAIKVDELPAPRVVERKGSETILTEIKDWLAERYPDLEPILEYESEPIVKILEAWAYREMLLRAEFDDAGRGNLLAFAEGAQLDHLAAFYGVTRQIVQVGDASVIPPVPNLLEDDARLRTRVQLALEGYTTAGPRGSYVFWGLSASPSVKDIGVDSPNPGQVVITVLDAEGDGKPSAKVQAAVVAKLNDEDVRPLTDQVIVQPAEIIGYDVVATLTLYHGPDAELVRLAAEDAVTAYVDEHHRLGHDITISGLHAALHQPGVQKVTLTSPPADIVVTESQAACCNAVDVTVGGRDV